MKSKQPNLFAGTPPRLPGPILPVPEVSGRNSLEFHQLGPALWPRLGGAGPPSTTLYKRMREGSRDSAKNRKQTSSDRMFSPLVCTSSYLPPTHVAGPLHPRDAGATERPIYHFLVQITFAHQGIKSSTGEDGLTSERSLLGQGSTTELLVSIKREFRCWVK